ncbi:MAG: ATP-binding protein [Syntrophobacterales bacterium]|jgi:anti-sigma regulatory factor (Ser/Thr protein kinase)|nr:ATP-binding protein [Syntrophobacterales bacterium]
MKTLGGIRLSGDIYSLPVMLEFVTHHARNSGLQKERISEVLRAIEEAISNILEEAYGNVYGEIDLTCSEDTTGRLIITITDFAPPSNVLNVTGAVAEQGGITGGVAGRFSTVLMGKLINNITYERIEDRNVLTFTVEEVA